MSAGGDPAGGAALRWLTRLAMGLAIAIVVARATTLETLRNPLDVLPGATEIPRGAGAAEGLLLDLLSVVPTLLVLARRAVDPGYRLRLAGSHLAMVLLALWAVASTFWASDRFAAAVGSFHWFSAMALLWAVSQAVRRWSHFRLVAAAAFGLLLVLAAQGIYYRLVELPDLRADWKANSVTYLRERGLEPGEFAADQFERRVLAGEMMGFSSSSNTFGAQLVLLACVAGGILIHQLRAAREGLFRSSDVLLPTVVAVGLVASVAIIPWTGSRTALATAVLAAGLFALLLAVGRHLHARPRLAFAVGLVMVVLAGGAVVAYGLIRGQLFHDSLTFRWRYWIGGWRVLLDHPLLGVGWDNFGSAYLGARLFEATEEVRDPHNLLVRFLAELGFVGGALAVAWLVRLAWELTTAPARPAGASQPALSARDDDDRAPSAIASFVVIGVVAMLLNAAVSIDFTQGSSFTFLELLERVGMLCIFVFGGVLASLRSVERPAIDDRTAPWILNGCLIGLGLFLLHNLVDFSLFETGVTPLFALLTGAALGVRAGDGAGRIGSRRVALFTLIGGVVAWLVVAFTFAGPVIVAESHAADADRAVRQNQPGVAAQGFLAALEKVPYDADYAFRAAQSLHAAGQDPRPLANRAIALDPMSPKYHLGRAKLELATPHPDWSRVRDGFERAIALDPQNIENRIDYAAALERAGDREAARRVLAEALAMHDRLVPGEFDRLPQKRIDELKAHLQELDSSAR